MPEGTSEIGLRKFEWPERSEFFRMQDEYVHLHVHELAEDIKKQNFSLTDTQLMDLSTILSKANFVGQYMLDLRPVEITCETSIGCKNFKNVNTPGICAVTYAIGNTEYALDNIPVESLHLATLKRISAGVNIYSFVRYLKAQDRLIQDEEEYYAYETKLSEVERNELVGQFKVDKREQLAIEAQRIMVEEVAHVLFYNSLEGNPVKFRMFYEESKKYPNFNENEGVFEELLTPEEQHNYLGSNIEQRARLWVSSFLDTYFPDSSAATNVENELQRMKELNERKRKGNE